MLQRRSDKPPGRRGAVVAWMLRKVITVIRSGPMSRRTPPGPAPIQLPIDPTFDGNCAQHVRMMQAKGGTYEPLSLLQLPAQSQTSTPGLGLLSLSYPEMRLNRLEIQVYSALKGRPCMPDIKSP
jgi:hypothetical protein